MLLRLLSRSDVRRFLTRGRKEAVMRYLRTRRNVRRTLALI